MLKLNDVSAWIEVDGQELEQYGIEEDAENNLVTCWIATQAGKNFSVVYRDNSPYRDHGLGFYLTLDGTDCSGRLIYPTTHIGTSESIQSRTQVQKERTISPTSTRDFVFSKLELTDEDQYLDETSKHLGEIEIIVRRCQVLDAVPWTTTHEVNNQTKVHERSKKAMSHCVSYGQEKKIPMTYCRNLKYLDQKPLTKFIFRYRDYALLQANGIIPRPPEENPAAAEEVIDLTTTNNVKREPAGDDIEDVEALDDAILAMQNKRAALLAKRSKSGASGAPPAKRVKREKFVPTIPGEVIDLT